MKKPSKSFAQQYPYLNYWINSWGWISIGFNEDFPYGGFLKVIDTGGVCYECDRESTLDELFEKAEKYLRDVESRRFDKETIYSLEEAYKKLGL
jgi:hypothetical protein